MKILQINTVYRTGGSTGRIVYDLVQIMNEQGFDAYVVYGYGAPVSSNGEMFKTQNLLSRKISILKTRLFGKHGFYNYGETQKAIAWIDKIHPDVIHLHNLHNHYINIELLFDYIKKKNIPVVWTLHDCWAYTGGCAYYDYNDCQKWKTGCYSCPALKDYPKTWFFDRSRELYEKKKQVFTGVEKMTIVTPSDWLGEEVRTSFLGTYEVVTINNGVDIKIFSPRINEIKVRKELGVEAHQKMVLAVASVFTKRKGIDFLLRLPQKLQKNMRLVLVGVDKSLVDCIDDNIIAITRTEDIDKMAEIYSAADIFINPTLEDNFPTTNLEALACGTPVITYSTGGSPESITKDTGVVIQKGDEDSFLKAIHEIPCKVHNQQMSETCREYAVNHFDKNQCFRKYLELYRKFSGIRRL